MHRGALGVVAPDLFASPLNTSFINGASVLRVKGEASLPAAARCPQRVCPLPAVLDLGHVDSLCWQCCVPTIRVSLLPQYLTSQRHRDLLPAIRGPGHVPPDSLLPQCFTQHATVPHSPARRPRPRSRVSLLSQCCTPRHSAPFPFPPSEARPRVSLIPQCFTPPRHSASFPFPPSEA